MGFLKRLFARKRGGTRVGNFIRQTISRNTFGLSDELGITDGHRNGGIGTDRSFEDNSENED